MTLTISGFGYKTIGFDLKNTAGLAGPYFDIGVAFWLIDPDLKEYSPEHISRVFLGREWRGRKADVREVFRAAHKRLKEEGLLHIFTEIEMPLLSILRELEVQGVLVDSKKLRALKKELEAEIDFLQKKIFALAGETFNLNSPKQLAYVLFEKLRVHPSGESAGIKKTEGGLFSTRSEQLQKYRKGHPIIEPILEYRSAHKLLRTYVDPILLLLDKNGRLHTTFVQTGTATGRLSSETPNLQNIPVAEDGGTQWGKKLRSAFVAPLSHQLVAFDYSQLELRILASLAGDPVMIQSFEEGKDIHAITASQIFHVLPEKVTKEMRRVAKTLNFGVVYGMGSTAFAEVSGLSLADAKKFIKEYFEHFPRIRTWQEGMRREAKRSGFVSTLTGRKRKLEGIYSSSPRIASYSERIAINMPIQGLGADILKRAMISCREKLLEKRLWGREARMLLSIHDELLFEVRNDKIEEVAVLVSHEMESAHRLKVPLVVNVSKGRNWGTLRPFREQN